jgi:hypothetical protein
MTSSGGVAGPRADAASSLLFRPERFDLDWSSPGPALVVPERVTAEALYPSGPAARHRLPGQRLTAPTAKTRSAADPASACDRVRLPGKDDRTRPLEMGYPDAARLTPA